MKQSPDLPPTDSADSFDIAQFINSENLALPSPSISSPLSFRPGTIATPGFASQASVPTLGAPQQLFAAPSHQYEQYKQQSSLPVGAVANTFAFNESDAFYESYDMMPAIDGYFGYNNIDEMVDLPAGTGSSNMDMDFASAPVMDNVNYTSGSIPLGSTGDGVVTPVVAPAPPVRAWPGMHQQQAAIQAKAQAEAQAQALAQRQEQSRQASVGHSRASSQSGHAEADPHVEESIARLLDRMRHSSVSTSAGNGDSMRHNSANDQYTASGRLKKDEEDMDEDERLLASEEGKKLSSKERRQLRNKVSARAFRSRRKEYIGQLEGELAAKATEADDLRVRNQKLSAENVRLTDLTRMLLSSSHFSSFLGDLSASGGSVPGTSATSAQTSQSRSTSASRKDAGDNPSGNNMHIGLAMIPESQFEHEASPIGWTSTTRTGPGHFDQQVYAVRSLPEDPIINGPSLSGKPALASSWNNSKQDLPCLPVLPSSMDPGSSITNQAAEPDPTIVFDASDPLLQLYGSSSDMTAKSTTQELQVLDPENFSQTCTRTEMNLVVTNDNERLDMDKYHLMIAALDLMAEEMNALIG